MKKKVFPIIIITVILAIMLSINCFAADGLDDGNSSFVLTEVLETSSDLRQAILDGSFDLSSFVGSYATILQNNSPYGSGVVSRCYVLHLNDDRDILYFDFVDDPEVYYIYDLTNDTDLATNTDVVLTDFNYANVDVAFKLVGLELSDYIDSSKASIFGTFARIPGFLVQTITGLTSIFWLDGSFTVLGVLSMAALSFALILLLFNVVRKFITFGG